MKSLLFTTTIIFAALSCVAPFECKAQLLRLGASVGVGIPTRHTDDLSTGLTWCIEGNIGGDSARSFLHLAFESTTINYEVPNGFLGDLPSLQYNCVRVGALILLGKPNASVRGYIRPTVQLTKKLSGPALNIGVGVNVPLARAGSFFVDIAPTIVIFDGILPWVTMRGGFLVHI